MIKVRMLYPQRRWVSEQEIIMWAQDLWVNEALKCKCRECGTVTIMCQFGKPVVEVGEGEFAANDPNNPCECDSDCDPLQDHPRPEDFDECFEYLKENGDVTFARGTR